LTVLAAIGAIACLVLSTLILYTTVTIIGNVYGGWIGALRFYRLVKGKGKQAPFMWAVRRALSCWYGPRFDGEYGTYSQVGGLKVPLDGRDKVYRDRFERW